jgi:phosphoenolpyruvate phosphomutase
VVIVPTKYYTTPTDVFREAGFSTVIWANHLMRSSLTAMQETAKEIYTQQNLLNVEDQVVSVADVFRIQGEAELEKAEKLYLPQSGVNSKAIILAAARGVELGELTKDKPKAMVEIAGKPLLARIADTYRSVGIKDIHVVRGYQKQAVTLPSIAYHDNDLYSSTQELYSLYQARSALNDSCLIAYGDVLIKKYIAEELLESSADFTVMVDANWKQSRNRGRHTDLVKCSEPNSKNAFFSRVTLKDLGSDPEASEVHGEWMGLLKVSKQGAKVLGETLDQLSKNEPMFKTGKIPDLIRHLIELGHTVDVIYTTGHWLDVDSLEDVALGGNF